MEKVETRKKIRLAIKARADFQISDARSIKKIMPYLATLPMVSCDGSTLENVPEIIKINESVRVKYDGFKVSVIRDNFLEEHTINTYLKALDVKEQNILLNLLSVHYEYLDKGDKQESYEQ